MAGVADLVDLTVGRHQADAEELRVGLGQFRDVGGDLSLIHVVKMACSFRKKWRMGEFKG
jgi:hypothetical protein